MTIHFRKNGPAGFEEYESHLQTRFGLSTQSVCALQEFKVDINLSQFAALKTSTFSISPYRTEATQATLSRPAHEECYALHILNPSLVRFCQDGLCEEMSAGTLALLDTRKTGFAEYLEPISGAMVTIPVQYWHALAPAPRPDDHYMLRTHRRICGLAHKMAFEIAYHGQDLPGEYRETVARQLIELLSLSVVDASDKLPGTIQQKVRVGQIKQFIRNNIADPNLNLSSISQHFGISSRLVTSIFGQQGQSVMDYVWEMRLRRSTELLTTGKNEISIKEVSYLCGFKFPSHFASMFRKKFDRSPRDYRNQINAQKSDET